MISSSELLTVWLLALDSFGIIAIATMLILIGYHWLPNLQRMRVWI